MLNKVMPRNKEPWFTQEIGDLIHKRQAAKNTDQYSIIHKEIQQVCKEAKEEWMKKQCTEIEELEQKHEYHYLHIKIKTTTNVKRFLDSRNSIMDKAEEISTMNNKKSKTGGLNTLMNHLLIPEMMVYCLQ